ncbi:hypothetical protein B9Z55_012348 [Caenorhabditis nigoni]|uniref:Sdz-33 F-box domain-containing protein n=1 Tax=Caenorhabditis nigoni TaxID=1611254 RepID=A0A2G5TWX4_9PELO|nr:hypothetical protein B9Z55_012348 [Caenorhabditis nigoni]
MPKIFFRILFSLLSKRAKFLAKRIRWNPLDIRLTSGVDPQICLQPSTVPGHEWIIDYEKEKELSEYPFFQSTIRGPTALHFLFLQDNGIENIKHMIEHICEVFRSPITELQIFEESLIEWIIKFQPMMRHVSIRKDVIISARTLDRISKSLKMTDLFGIDSVAIDENFHITEPIPCPSILIYNSFWITLPSILNGTNSIIRLYDSKLTAKDINTILKEWQLGNKLQNLKYLKIHNTLLNANEVFEDLNPTVSFGNVGRPMTVEIYDEQTVKLVDVAAVLNLTRNDGKILSIFQHYEVFEDEIMKICLNLQVWSKQA